MKTGSDLNRMTEHYPVGILGGGQLAAMLVEAALRLGMSPVVLTEDRASKAAKMAGQAVYAPLSDERALREFLGRVEIVLFENEFVDTTCLASAARGTKARFLPSLETITELQDKLRQKHALARLSIPSAPFEELSASGDAKSWITKIFTRWPKGCVFKWAKLGYDGKGVLLSRSKSEEVAAALSFCEEAKKKGVAVYAEERVEFKRELAIIGCRALGGEFHTYPLVISEQSEGVCDRVYGPAVDYGVKSVLHTEAAAYALKLAEEFDLIGSFALELFENAQGALWVNEIAPRVHNSGHYTLNACGTSQFENHCRAALGLPLGSTESAPSFAMVNLLGPGLSAAKAKSSIPLPEPGPRSQLYWYDKGEIRHRRKLGHLNAVSFKARIASELLEELDRARLEWLNELEKA